MTHTCTRRWRFVSSVASALMLVSAGAAAQTPPTPQEPPASTGAPADQQPTAPAGAPQFNPPEPVPPKPSYPAIGPGREIRINDHFSLKFGVQVQAWTEALQDQLREQPSGDSGAYQYNMFIRRLRLLTGAQPWETVSLFLLIEGTNLGRGSGVATDPKTFNSIALVDGWLEIKFHDALMLEAGLMLVPLARNILQATTTYITLDIGNTSAQHINATQTKVLRDVGLMLKGTLMQDHFEYRLGVFAGIREPPVTMPPTKAGSRNSPRLSGYLQYNFLDGDKGYVFNGTYYGKKRIAGVAVGADYQKGEDKDAYWAASAAAFLAYPINGPNPKTGADEVAAIAQFVHYDGGTTAVPLPEQNDFLAELGYYNVGTKLSAFGKFEGRFVKDDFAPPAQPVPDQLWFGGGIKFHLIENLTNFTLFFQHSRFPDDPAGLNSFNQFVFAVQGLYY